MTEQAVANPFATAQRNAAPVAIQQSREVAEIQAAMTIAKRFPRDPIAAMDRIINACTRPSLAEGALYSYQRGGQEVTGPSIRLAEALAQSWGNIQFGIRELEQNDKESTVEAFAFDLETNTRQVKVFQVPHMRHSKRGVTKLTDPRDIYEIVANQGARRMRACILGVIPGDVTEAAKNQCEVTLHAHSEATPETIKKMVEAFGKFGVTQDQIQKKLGKRVDAINSANIVQLKKIYQSLKDGMSKPEDQFDTTKAEADVLNDAILGEQKDAAPPKEEIIARINAAQTEGELMTIRSESKHLTGQDREDVKELWAMKMELVHSVDVETGEIGNAD